MFWRIVRRELIEHVTSFRFGAIFIFTLLLMVTSVLVFAALVPAAVSGVRPGATQPTTAYCTTPQLIGHLMSLVGPDHLTRQLRWTMITGSA